MAAGGGEVGADVDALLPHAERALEWIERFGDRDGDGFIEYQRATDRGNAATRDWTARLLTARGSPPRHLVDERQGVVGEQGVAVPGDFQMVDDVVGRLGLPEGSRYCLTQLDQP